MTRLPIDQQQNDADLVHARLCLGVYWFAAQHLNEHKNYSAAIQRRNRQQVADAQENANQRHEMQHQAGTFVQAALQELAADLADADDADWPRILAAERAVEQATRNRSDDAEGLTGRPQAVCNRVREALRNRLAYKAGIGEARPLACAELRANRDAQPALAFRRINARRYNYPELTSALPSSCSR